MQADVAILPPMQTPAAVMTPLPPPPKWAARGSAQLGALVASPAKGTLAPPAGRPTIARYSMQTFEVLTSFAWCMSLQSTCWTLS